MTESLTQVGVGGVLAILIIREVFTFVGSKKANSTYGQYVRRDEYEVHKGSVQSKDTCRMIIERLNERHEAQEKQFDRIDKQFEEVKTLIRNGHEK